MNKKTRICMRRDENVKICPVSYSNNKTPNLIFVYKDLNKNKRLFSGYFFPNYHPRNYITPNLN